MPTRRTVLAGGAAALALASPLHAAGFAPAPGAWNRFRTVTTLALPSGGAPAQAWVPVPDVTEPGWAEAGATTFTGNATRAALVRDVTGRTAFVHAVWEAGTDAPTLQVTSDAAARDRAVDLNPRRAAPLSPADRAHYLAPTDLIPTDGIVAETAARITDGATTDLEKARRIYDWIVTETTRNPETRGCGLGDVGSMLEMGDLTGKCADLNALLVGLSRASGLPARDVFGLRAAPSAFGYRSLGVGSSDVTRAQHCRAEIFVDTVGWIPVDPADVRKVMLEEPPKDLPLTHPKVAAARDALFGGWEGNWIALNFAHDVELPGAQSGPVPFLMYPEAEIDGQRQDALSPDAFAYNIEVSQLG